jgi:organic hydroperoxide reductase OsmC/OhrA
MSEHKASIQWDRGGTGGADFLKGRFSRAHNWSFDGGLTIAASASPSVVPAAYCNVAGVDPEEAFVASIASCHMLTYIYLASKQGFQVDGYKDDAVGMLSKTDSGAQWISAVTLHPRIAYGGDRTPTAADEERLHHQAHQQCFITNSVKTAVTVRSPD